MSAKHPLTLFETEELARLAERARLDVHGAVKGEPVKKGVKLSTKEEIAMQDRERARLVRGLAALRLTSRCYALARDPAGLTPIVWGAWAVRSWHDLFETHVDSAQRIGTAVLAVGPRVFEVPGLAEALASSPLPAVRRALAEALPNDPASEPLLRALAHDDDAEVRAAARKRVQDDDRWGGAFPISPEGHPDDVLQAARTVLEQRDYQRDVEEVVSAFAPLSDALAVACWERLLAPYAVGEEILHEGVGALLERPGGGEGFARLVERWGSKAVFASRLVKAVRAGLSEQRRIDAFGELLRVLGAVEPSADEVDGTRLHEHLARAAAALKPPRGDARALLETILGGPIERASEGTPADEHDSAANALSVVLASWPLDDALRATLVEMRRAGKPGRWARVGARVWDGLGPDPVLRERAWRDLDTGDESARSKAVSALLGPLHDRAEDGSVDELAERLYERPELRAFVLRQQEALLARAREDLVAGRLDLKTALVVMHRTPEDEQTDAMWAAARALRDRAMADPEDTSWPSPDGLTALIHPGDEWEASDLAYVRAVVELGLTAPGKHGYLPFAIAALERKEAEESAALLREIDERATTDEIRASVELGRNMSAAFRAMRG